MAKQIYVAVLERGPNGTFSAFFPDLPGCVTAGDTADETMIGAGEALALHVEGMLAEGLDLPQPSSVHAFGEEDFPESDIVRLFWVPIEVSKVETSPPVRINISLPEALVTRIDNAARSHGLTRSGLLALASRQWMAANRVGAPTASKASSSAAGETFVRSTSKRNRSAAKD